MNVIMRHDTTPDDSDDGGAGGGGGAMTTSTSTGKYECDNCRTEFPNKTTADRHMLFCRTLAEIRRGGGGGAVLASSRHDDDALMPTPREMFTLIQELAAKYNKVKDELDVMKQWAKMVGRRINSAAGGAAGAAAAGLDFTSVTRQKRQNMEVILNEEDEEHPHLAELRPGFAEWIAAPSLVLTDTDLHMVFNEDLVAGITAAILRVLAGHTAESGRAHLIPFKLADIKQGAFYIYETAFGVAAAPPPEIGPDPPAQQRRRWRAMEACEFQLLVRTFHKLLFKEFKKWQDMNWAAQRELTKQRQNAASSYHHVMSSLQCSPAMAGGGAVDAGVDAEVEVDADAEIAATAAADTPIVLSEDFATLYNKYADKMMGGALSDDTILSRVRAKLWKDMKAWRL
jgi:hypothetical protein